MAYIASGMLGANTGSSSDGTTPLTTLGKVADWVDTTGSTTTGAGGHATYVYAASAIAVGNAVVISPNGTAQNLTNALGTAAFGRPAFADFYAFASGEYGWVKNTGPLTGVNALTLAAASVALFTSATAGAVDDFATGQTLIRGLYLQSSNSASTNRVAAVSTTFPFFQPGATS